MAKKTHFEFKLEYLNRCALAWEALRLNPEYREDWKTHKRLLLSPEAGIPNSITWRTLARIAKSKWGIRKLINPYTPQPIKRHLAPPRLPPPASTHNDKMWKHAHLVNFVNQIEEKMRGNPFLGNYPTIDVYPGYPLVNIKPLSARAASFSAVEKRKGNELFWVNNIGIRYLTLQKIYAAVETRRVTRPKKLWKNTAEVQRLVSDGYLILAIPLVPPDNKFLEDKIREQIKHIVRKACPAYRFSQIKRAWDAFRLYELHQYRGMTYNEIIQTTFPLARAALHKREYSAIDKSAAWRSLARQLAYARRLIRENDFVPHLYRQKDWQKVSIGS